MHDVADSSSDNDHLPTISLAHSYNATQAPVCIICITLKEREKHSKTSVYYLSLPHGICFSFDISINKTRQQTLIYVSDNENDHVLKLYMQLYLY